MKSSSGKRYQRLNVQKRKSSFKGAVSPVYTSWHQVGDWYNNLVGSKGQYYHNHVVLPGVIRLLHLDSQDSLLDIGCGQGVLARHIQKSVLYTGVDAAPSLIASAKQYDRSQTHEYFVADATKPLPLKPQIFTHVAIVLSMQNIEFPDRVMESIRPFVTRGTVVVLVLNHPGFRIPRQSSWGIDEENKLQYRKINRYMTPQKIPITMHPGSGSSAMTWSFHQPISYYVTLFTSRNYMLSAMEEWVSDKESVGGAARMENRARSEFPLFLAMKFICR